jgi:non-ribosomal peptide synthase protein (TIGR01720 family)
MRDPDAPRMHLIEVDGSVVADRLTFEWTYAGRCFARETVARLVRLFMGEVRDLVADRRLASEAELAASDFPDADLGQDDLDRLLATFAGSEG